MTAKTNKAVFIFLAVLFSLEFFKKGILLLLKKSYFFKQNSLKPWALFNFDFSSRNFNGEAKLV